MDLRKRLHWYFLWVGECPLCGRDKSYREYRLGVRPKNPRYRYGQLSLEECYDHCGG